MKKMPQVVIGGWSGYFAAALLCQLLFGSFPETFFAFPVNVAWLLLGAVGLWVAFREKCCRKWVSVLAAPSTSFLLLGLLVVSCLIQGLSGKSLTTTWWFIALLAALLVHLTLVLYGGISRRRSHRLRFILIHAGLLLALIGGFLGAPDKKEWRTMAGLTQPTSEAVDEQGSKISMEHELKLTALHATFAPDGMPLDYDAKLRVDNNEEITLKVNHPYRLSWQDDLYLASILPAANGNNPDYCVLQWVRQPWKYVIGIGIWMLIAGSVLLFVQGASRKKGGSHDYVE